MNISYFVRRFFTGLKNIFLDSDVIINLRAEKPYRFWSKATLINVKIGKYTYIAANSSFRNTSIGNFCSIGPNVMCGLAFHPTNGFSTSPIFYSKNGACGVKLTKHNLVAEYKDVFIGNDVFIGANVSIIGGVKISDGAIVAAGSVVVKDVPPYAIVGGAPARVLKYRFDENAINRMIASKWWNLPVEKLKNIPDVFFDIEAALDFLDKQNNS